MVATAVKLAGEHGATVEALHVIRVPLDLARRARCPRTEAQAEASLAEARALGEEHGVEVVGDDDPRPRDRRAIVDHARATGADLIVLGSSPRWRRQSRFFSPTVDFVLRHGAVRGADRRLPAAGARRGARRDLSAVGRLQSRR